MQDNKITENKIVARNAGNVSIIYYEKDLFNKEKLIEMLTGLWDYDTCLAESTFTKIKEIYGYETISEMLLKTEPFRRSKSFKNKADIIDWLEYEEKQAEGNDFWYN